MSELPPLPFEPEPLESIKARFPLAIAEPFDVLGGITGKSGPLPSKQRKHVFDFEDGMRMMASRDMHVDGAMIHFSFSGDEKFAKQFPDLTQCVAHFTKVMNDFHKGEIIISFFSTRARHCFLKYP